MLLLPKGELFIELPAFSSAGLLDREIRILFEHWFERHHLVRKVEIAQEEMPTDTIHDNVVVAKHDPMLVRSECNQNCAESLTEFQAPDVIC